MDNKISDVQHRILDEHLRKYLGLKHTAPPPLQYQMYGYYMQATQGDCCSPKPSKEEVEARLKWKAWYNVRNLTRTDARNHFIEKVRSLEQLSMIRNNTGPDFLYRTQNK